MIKTMKKIIKLSLVLVIFCMVTFFLVGCKKNKNELSRVTIDINPSIELIVDSDNKVVSVTALNDDGNVIIVGEAIVGKTADEAVAMIVSIASDTGYLVKGNVEASENEIKISVSGEGRSQKKLYASIEKKVEKVISEEKIEAAIVKQEALKQEALKKLALDADPLLTAEEVEQMSETELLNVIKLARIERAVLYTEELEKMYNEAKAYEIELTEKEEVRKVIDELDVTYQLVKTQYGLLVDSFSKSITSIEEAKYTYFVSPESTYQKEYAKLLEAKKELLEQKAEVANLPEGQAKEDAKAELAVKERIYNEIQRVVDEAYNFAMAIIDELVKGLRAIEARLNDVLDSLPSEIKTTLNAKTEEIEAVVNAKKQNFFATFEEAHKEDILYYKNLMLEQKQELIEENK